jgi:hypothetical protein
VVPSRRQDAAGGLFGMARGELDEAADVVGAVGLDEVTGRVAVDELRELCLRREGKNEERCKRLRKG